MATRTNLRQQLLKEQPDQRSAATRAWPVAHTAGASAASSSLSASANSDSPSGSVGLSFGSRLENPTAYHLAQQHQQQDFHLKVPVAMPAADATSPSLGSQENSPDSDLPMPNDIDVDIDMLELLDDKGDLEYLSSTMPNHPHLPLSSGQTFGDFGRIGVGDNGGGGGGVIGSGFATEAKPSTSAPASTHLFLTGGSRLSAHHFQQQQAQQSSLAAPASLESSDSRAASLSSSLAGGGQSQQQQQAQPPRDRSRKDSHNRIERKRRENINFQIGELGEIIPRGYFQDGDFKKNKGNILKASVDYIRELQADQARLTERAAQSDLRAEKLDQLSRALAVQIQNMQQSMSASGVQYQQANSIDDSVVNGLLNFLANAPTTSTAAAAQVKAEPHLVVHLQQQRQQQPEVAVTAVVADPAAMDSLTLNGDADPMFGFSDANSPLFSDP